MRFGDHIRNLRRSLGWTQPEAAKQIGIEQSYLSKLESGKSYPSEDVYASLVAAYAIDTDALADQLYPAEIDRLRDIEHVRASVLRRDSDAKKRAKTWLVAGTGLLILGGGSLALTFLGEDTVVQMNKYKSDSIILTGDASDGAPSLNLDEEELTQTGDILYRDQEEYLDVVYFERVPEGQRVWRFFGSSSETKKSPLRWFLVPALMSLFGAFGCFFASYRER